MPSLVGNIRSSRPRLIVDNAGWVAVYYAGILTLIKFNSSALSHVMALDLAPRGWRIDEAEVTGSIEQIYKPCGWKTMS